MRKLAKGEKRGGEEQNKVEKMKKEEEPDSEKRVHRRIMIRRLRKKGKV